MLFHTLPFFIFFTIVFTLYWRLPHRSQNRLLLAASYFFYGWWDWRFLSLLILSSAIDYQVGKRLAASNSTINRRRWLGVSLVTNLGLLGWFKYFNFFAAGLSQLLATVGVSGSFPLLHIILPVGISFYTFQELSYTIDIYRGQLQPARRFGDFALFVSFFPQLIAGPIERATHLLPQIERPRTRLTRDRIIHGLWLFWWGLWLKVFVADGLAPLVDTLFDPARVANGVDTLLGAVAFSWQLFADFAGYSSMARGLASLLGFDLMVNFNQPFWSQNVRELWQRWHISLSSWVRDYIYIPLGGNRRGEARAALNIFVTMTIMGLWHGAGGQFIVWGMYFGLAAIIYRLYRESGSARRWARLRLIAPRFVWHVNVLTTFVVFAASMILFRAPSLGQAATLFNSLLHLTLPPSAAQLTTLIQVISRVGIVIIASVLLYRQRDPLAIAKLPNLVKAPLIGTMLYGLLFYGHSGEVFLYFAF